MLATVLALLPSMPAGADSAWIRPVRVDLLRLFDPACDLVRGGFGAEPGRLNLAPSSLVQIPYVPPEEYDLTLVVERKEQKGKLVIGLASGAAQFDVVIDNFLREEHRAGLHVVDGLHITNRTDAHVGTLFTNDTPSVVVCRVRRTGLQVTVDGRSIVDWKEDFRRLSVNPTNRIPDARLPFLNTAISRFHITRMDLRPESGFGSRLRRE